MGVIETKFSVGDTVYVPDVQHETIQIECPDCLGTRTWVAELPNGEREKFTCPTCEHGYESRGTIGSYEVTARVRVMTIGSVRVDTAAKGPRRIEYMCEETGVGSGSVYAEDRFYATGEEAAKKLPDMVKEKRIALEENRARNAARRKKDRMASMVAHYRRQIRDAKKDIAAAERGLAREGAK